MSPASLTLVPASAPVPSDIPDRPLSGLAAAAAYLGLDQDELVAWLDHGGSLPVLARALGRSADDAVEIVLTHAPNDDAGELRRRVVTGRWRPRPAADAASLAA